MNFNVEELTSTPNQSEIDDISVLLQQLLGKDTPTETIESNVLQIVNNPCQFFQVVRDNNRIIAMQVITLKVLPQEKTIYSDCTVVHSDFKNQGIGTMLCKATAEYADSICALVQGTVSSKRKEAWELYKSLGYEQWDTRFIVRKPKLKQ